MKKKFKFILSLSSAALIPTLPIVSAATKEPKLDPNFNSFEATAKKQMEEMIDKALAEAISYINSRYQSLIDSPSDNLKERIQNLFYFEQLLKYFKDNKDKIKKEPEKYGFHIVFPFVISKNRKYDIADIDFNGKVYKGIKVANTAPLDYSRAIEPKGKKSVKEKDQVNAFTQAKFSASIGKYSNELIKRIKSIIFNDSDVPEIDKDVKLQKSSDGITISLPQGFKNWHDYIYSKIRPRYVDFDLKQNQESEDPKQPEAKPNHPPSIPPLVPGDTNVIELEKLEESITSLPLLMPYTTKDFSNFNSYSLKNAFDSKTEAEKSKMFYFNNPINTRYEYKVSSFETKTDDPNNIHNVTIYITDRVNLKSTRSYIFENVKLNNLAKWNELKQNQIEITKKTFSKLFTALEIDDKIDYSKIKNQFIQNALFNLVESASKLIFSRKENSFEHNENERIADNFDKDVNEALLKSLADKTVYNLLSSLSSLKINSIIFWKLLPQAFEAVHSQFQEVIKFNKEYIKENIKTINGDLDKIVDLFAMNKKDIFNLNGLVRTRTFDIFKWYDKYLELTNKIIKTFNSFSNITINKNIKTNNILKENFQKSYKLAEEILNNSIKENNIVKRNIAITLLTFGAFFLIISIVALSLKLKNKEAKYLLATGLIILTIALALLTGGSVLLALTKGI